MGPFFIVVSTPSLQLFLGVGKVHEPMGIQSFDPEPTIEGLYKGIVGRFAGP